MSKDNLQIEIAAPEKECPYWIVNFPNLFVGAQGETLAEAVQNGFVALKLWVDDCYERGTLDDALREGGLEDLCSGVLKNAVSQAVFPLPNSTLGQSQCRV